MEVAAAVLTTAGSSVETNSTRTRAAEVDSTAAATSVSAAGSSKYELGSASDSSTKTRRPFSGFDKSARLVAAWKALVVNAWNLAVGRTGLWPNTGVMARKEDWDDPGVHARYSRCSDIQRSTSVAKGDLTRLFLSDGSDGSTSLFIEVTAVRMTSGAMLLVKGVWVADGDPGGRTSDAACLLAARTPAMISPAANSSTRIGSARKYCRTISTPSLMVILAEPIWRLISTAALRSGSLDSR